MESIFTNNRKSRPTNSAESYAQKYFIKS